MADRQGEPREDERLEEVMEEEARDDNNEGRGDELLWENQLDDDEDNGDDDDEEFHEELVLMEDLEIQEIHEIASLDGDWTPVSSGDENEGEDQADENGGEQFDKTLPSRHQYLGETQELRGRTMQDENEYVTMPLLLHNSLMNLVLLPSQTLPMTIFHPLHANMLRNVITKDRTFGIVHSKVQDGNLEMAKYGTTAEIYEYQEEEHTGALSIKAKGRQRFKVMSTRKETTGLMVARVRILPEIRMENPFEMMRLHSLDKFTLPHPPQDQPRMVQERELSSVRTKNCWRVRGRNAWLTPWPSWIYNQYDDLLLAQKITNEIKRCTMISPSAIALPRDPQELSHWAAINLPLDDTHRLALLSLNTPTQRLRYILSVLAQCKMLICIYCKEVLGDTADIFSMSVEGPQGTFVNPGGFVHEMLTLSRAHNLTYYGHPSTEHSWYPGYAWTIASCAKCRQHIGWKFTATKRKLKPQKFYGLTRKSVRGKLVWDEDEKEMRPII